MEEIEVLDVLLDEYSSLRSRAKEQPAPQARSLSMLLLPLIGMGSTWSSPSV